MNVQYATFSKLLNLRNIDKCVSDIRIRIRIPFESSFWISVSGCKLTILPDIQPANRSVIISAIYVTKQLIDNFYVGLLSGILIENVLFRQLVNSMQKHVQSTTGVARGRSQRGHVDHRRGVAKGPNRPQA